MGSDYSTIPVRFISANSWENRRYYCHSNGEITFVHTSEQASSLSCFICNTFLQRRKILPPPLPTQPRSRKQQQFAFLLGAYIFFFILF
jgi:hypothetical protein